MRLHLVEFPEIECPCKDCKKRSVYCHGVCFLYHNYKCELDQANDQLKQYKAKFFYQ